MNAKVLDFAKKQLKEDVPFIEAGQTVKVHQKIKEGDKERVQVFEGMVIALKGATPISRTIMVRKVSNGVGVERIFPVNSPLIEKIEIVRSSKVRRAKLYYIRRKEVKMKDDKVKQERAEKRASDIAADRKKKAEEKTAREEAKKKIEEAKVAAEKKEEK